MTKSNAERQATKRNKNKDAGLVAYLRYVKPEWKVDLDIFLQTLKDKEPIQNKVKK